MSTTEAKAVKDRVKTMELFSEVEGDLPKVEEAIEKALDTRHRLLLEVSTHLLKAGGKRLRPALVLLAAKFSQYQIERLMPVAAAVELIHMATLVHDDVVDSSTMRRGMPTVNAKWNKATSVLVGDYLFAKAFSLLAGEGNPRVVRVMADVVYQMSVGELQQMTGASDPDQTVDDYYDRIIKKTGLFIAESCRVGALVSGAAEEEAQALYNYGHGVGLGFQIIDDILDFTSNVRQLGKPVCSDLRGGIITLPVILALRGAPRKDELRRIVSSKNLMDGDVNQVVKILQESGSLEESYKIAKGFIKDAKAELKKLPKVPARATLEAVANFVVERKF